ncbi:hypothetical protein DL96DRAFT_1456245 [Flagelloscypha sp. PMI_526]|nr:hypothetical protein DL96DRAFT_1456245 [Flagelloscypha sp. PMI_526]
MKIAATSIVTIFGLPYAVHAFDWAKTKAVYAFGDSYTFVGGTYGHANYSFLKDYLDVSFTKEQLFTSEIIPKNTSSEGANWPEFLTGCGSGKPSKCKKQLWNFAFAGSDIDGNLLPLHHDYTIPLIDQVQQYLDYAYKYLPKKASETLVMWFIGINDTNDSANNKTITDFDAFYRLEMDSYFNNGVQKLYEAGHTNHLFLNVPPGRPVAGADQSYKILFNKILAEYIRNFSDSHHDAKAMSFDTFSFYNTLLADPTKYGFVDSTSYCTCPDPGYFWYNTGHPTELVHKLMAKEIDTTVLVPNSKHG